MSPVGNKLDSYALSRTEYSTYKLDYALVPNVFFWKSQTKYIFGNCFFLTKTDNNTKK